MFTCPKGKSFSYTQEKQQHINIIHLYVVFHSHYLKPDYDFTGAVIVANHTYANDGHLHKEGP